MYADVMINTIYRHLKVLQNRLKLLIFFLFFSVLSLNKTIGKYGYRILDSGGGRVCSIALNFKRVSLRSWELLFSHKVVRLVW